MAKTQRLLIVEDEETARNNLARILSKLDVRIDTAGGGVEALKMLEKKSYDLVLTDLRMEKVDGMEVLRKVRESHPGTEVIMITGYATVNSAIEAMQKGAFHYVPKPYKIDEVRALAVRALEKKELRDEVDRLKKDLKAAEGIPFIVGKSPKLEQLIETIRRVGPTDSSVLIMGETGTGKELVARAVHYASQRSENRFVAFNCAAFSEDLLANELFGHEKDAFTGATSMKTGLFEAADGGTVFLDEVGDMPQSMQIRLLRVLQEKAVLRVGGTDPVPVDVRVVAATNRDLKQMVNSGEFRSDLYYRLNVVTLYIPPLAERKDDIPLLARHFLQKHAKKQDKRIAGITDEMMEILMNYPFPGNVRELENIIERAVTLAVGDYLDAKDLPEDLKSIRFRAIRTKSGALPTLQDREREYIQYVLTECGGNQTRAAQVLGIDRVSLWRKLKKYDLAAED
jgi:DNA-binding NtrC family response regulator